MERGIHELSEHWTDEQLNDALLARLERLEKITTDKSAAGNIASKN